MSDQRKIVVRPAALSEAEALVDLAVRTYYETFAPVNTPENMQAYMSAAFNLPQFEAELKDPHGGFYLAEADSTLAGYAKLTAGETPECIAGPAPVQLARLYVDQRWHGTGVAHALMETCLSEARKQGFKTIYLGVWEHNERAQAFYRKWGFVRVGEHIFQMGDDPQTDWWMARSVEPGGKQ
jgi:ribosomal protein S18 acetylase RimI-like enzyme